MSVSNRVRERIDDYRPDTGSMGILYQRRRSLYWLVVAVGVLAYAGLVTFLVATVALVALGGVNAVAAAAGSSALAAYAWLGYAIASFAALATGTYLAAYIAGQYEVQE